MAQGVFSPSLQDRLQRASLSCARTGCPKFSARVANSWDSRPCSDWASGGRHARHSRTSSTCTSGRGRGRIAHHVGSAPGTIHVGWAAGRTESMRPPIRLAMADWLSPWPSPARLPPLWGCPLVAAGYEWTGSVRAGSRSACLRVPPYRALHTGGPCPWAGGRAGPARHPAARAPAGAPPRHHAGHGSLPRLSGAAAVRHAAACTLPES